MKRKITVRKRLGSWFVAIPGDVPDFSKHRHWTDAIAKVFFELRVPSGLKLVEKQSIKRA